jgi:hypothetical protein
MLNANTILYGEAWVTKLQERLDKPTIWKEICKVTYTDTRVLNNPYMTDATVQTTARGTAYAHQSVTETIDSITINAIGIIPMQIDRADLAQSTFSSQMDLAERQGVLLDEFIEARVMEGYSQATDFGDTGAGVLGLASTAITVSATNIDDIIRGVKTQIRKASGQKLLARNGGFIVWRPEDFELLEAFIQANGFTSADSALKNGTESGLVYMGMYHYASNSLTSGHLLGGVRKAIDLGIVKSTYGDVTIDEEPATADGALSAIAIISRVDYIVKIWHTRIPVMYDINVTAL